MKTYNQLYEEIYSMNNLANAWKEARKGKTKKIYVIEFEKELRKNLLELRRELLTQTYKPKPLVTFIVRDPKSRVISKSAFRDRIVHHALVRIIEPIFEKIFIYDSCANRKGKGNLFALNRFVKFKRKVSESGDCLRIMEKFRNNNLVFGYCLKADIRHYFQEVNQEILLKIIKRKIADEKVIWLIKQILNNYFSEKQGTGMPLGNLTSQFFANIYLNELDYFVKHKLKAKHYIRYVDDFVILHKSKIQLGIWKEQIEEFLKNELTLELHPDKSKILNLSRGIDFVGFRNLYYFKLLRERNIRKMNHKITQLKNGETSEEKFKASFNGWNAYAKWGDSYRLKKNLLNKITLN